MYYLTRMIGRPVTDATGARIGTIHDLAIATGEIFPRVTALAFVGPDKTPFMLSWRKFVDRIDENGVALNVASPDLRFSYLQPDEVLLSRDLLDKQIVDTQGMKVVRVNDLKLSESRSQLRLLGAEVGTLGLLRGISPALERAVAWTAKRLGRPLRENIIAWNYMDLLDRDLSQVKLSVTHKRLHELHPADVADILEQLSPSQRAAVFAHLDNDQAADAISELEDELQAEVIDDLESDRASDILEIMDPDDAADIVGDLPYDKAEALLRLMGVRESRQVRKLLGYKENTAGGIMTPEVITVSAEMTVEAVIDRIRRTAEEEEEENIYAVFVVGDGRVLEGVVPLRTLLVSKPDVKVADILTVDVKTADPDDDQEDVAEVMSKYDLLAIPVIDEGGRLLGMVTVDDALDVMEQEAAEDLALASGRPDSRLAEVGSWVGNATNWVTAWVVAGLITGGMLAYFGRWTVLSLAALFVPLVMRASDLVSSHSLGQLVNADEDTGTHALQRFGIDLVAGVSLGVISGLIALALLQVLSKPVELAALIGAAVALAVVVLAAIGAFLPRVLRREDGSLRASSSLVTSVMSAVGVGAFLSLAVALTAAAGK